MDPRVRTQRTIPVVAMLSTSTSPAEYAKTFTTALKATNAYNRDAVKCKDLNLRRSKREQRYSTGETYTKPIRPAATIPAIETPSSVLTGDRSRYE